MTRHGPGHVEVVGFAALRRLRRLAHFQNFGASVSARLTELKQSPLFSFGENLADLCAHVSQGARHSSEIAQSQVTLTGYAAKSFSSRRFTFSLSLSSFRKILLSSNCRQCCRRKDAQRPRVREKRELTRWSPLANLMRIRRRGYGRYCGGLRHPIHVLSP